MTKKVYDDIFRQLCHLPKINFGLNPCDDYFSSSKIQKEIVTRRVLAKRFGNPIAAQSASRNNDQTVPDVNDNRILILFGSGGTADGAI